MLGRFFLIGPCEQEVPMRSDEGETTGMSVRCANAIQNPIFCQRHRPLGLAAGCEMDWECCR